MRNTSPDGDGFARLPVSPGKDKEHCSCKEDFCLAAGSRKDMEVEVVRVKITLACTDCKQRNYNMTKEKKAHPDRMETKKYCRFCKKHTVHKETK